MVTIGLLIGCNIGAVTALLLVLQGFPASNAFGIYVVISLCALLITTQRALEAQDIGRIVRPPLPPC